MLDRIDRKLVLIGLELLKADNIRLGRFEPGQKVRQTPVDIVDVERVAILRSGVALSPSEALNTAAANPAGLLEFPPGFPFLVAQFEERFDVSFIVRSIHGRRTHRDFCRSDLSRCRTKLLVAVAHRQRLRRLDKATRPLGVFFNIHQLIPSACRPHPKHGSSIFIEVSARRIDVPQPSRRSSPSFERLGANVGIAGKSERGGIAILARRLLTISLKYRRSWAPSAGRRHYDCRLRTSSPGERRPSPAFRWRRGEGTLPRSRGALRPGFAWPPPKKGGCRECRVRSRGLVCNSGKNAHEKTRYRRSNPAFPAQWSYGLCRALRRRIRLVTVAYGLRFRQTWSGQQNLRGLGTSNGCRDHTVLPYAEPSFVLRAMESLTVDAALRLRRRADALASTASRPAFVTTRDPPLCRNETARTKAVIWLKCEVNYLSLQVWTGHISLESLDNFRFTRNGFTHNSRPFAPARN